MKTSHKIILMVSALCLIPFISEAKVRKLQDYKNAPKLVCPKGTTDCSATCTGNYTNYSTGSECWCRLNPNTRTTQYQEKCKNVLGTDTCQNHGYNKNLSTPPTGNTAKCYQLPGTTIGGIVGMCYKYKSYNGDDTSGYPYRDDECIAGGGVPAGQSKTFVVSCTSGTPNEATFHERCDCPAETVESGVDPKFIVKHFARTDGKPPYITITPKAGESKLCYYTDGVICKALSGNFPPLTAKFLQRQGFQIKENGSYNNNGSGGNLSFIMPEFGGGPAKGFILKNFAWYGSKADVNFAYICPITITNLEPEKVRMIECMSDLNKKICVLDEPCPSYSITSGMGTIQLPGMGKINYVYCGYCKDGSSPNPSCSNGNTPTTLGTYMAWYNNKWESLTCKSCVACTTQYYNGVVMTNQSVSGAYTQNGCAVTCSNGYTQVAAGSGSSYMSSLTAGASGLTMSGITALSGSTNGMTNNYTYTLDRLSLSSGSGVTLVCAHPTGCNAQVNWVPTTCNLDVSWCTWFNNN